MCLRTYIFFQACFQQLWMSFDTWYFKIFFCFQLCSLIVLYAWVIFYFFFFLLLISIYLFFVYILNLNWPLPWGFPFFVTLFPGLISPEKTFSDVIFFCLVWVILWAISMLHTLGPCSQLSASPALPAMHVFPLE